MLITPGTPLKWLSTKKLTTGNMNINSTAIGGMNIDTTLDVVGPAAVGDWLLCRVAGLWGNAAVTAYLDFYTWSGSALINPVGAGLDQVTANPGKRDGLIGAYSATSIFKAFDVSELYQVVAGDIVAGEVTMRLRGGTNTASNKILFATPQDELRVWVANLGQIAVE